MSDSLQANFDLRQDDQTLFEIENGIRPADEPPRPAPGEPSRVDAIIRLDDTCWEYDPRFDPFLQAFHRTRPNAVGFNLARQTYSDPSPEVIPAFTSNPDWWRAFVRGECGCTEPDPCLLQMPRLVGETDSEWFYRTFGIPAPEPPPRPKKVKPFDWPQYEERADKLRALWAEVFAKLDGDHPASVVKPDYWIDLALARKQPRFVKGWRRKYWLSPPRLTDDKWGENIGRHTSDPNEEVHFDEYAFGGKESDKRAYAPRLDPLPIRIAEAHAGYTHVIEREELAREESRRRCEVVNSVWTRPAEFDNRPHPKIVPTKIRPLNNELRLIIIEEWEEDPAAYSEELRAHWEDRLKVAFDIERSNDPPGTTHTSLSKYEHRFKHDDSDAMSIENYSDRGREPLGFSGEQIEEVDGDPIENPSLDPLTWKPPTREVSERKLAARKKATKVEGDVIAAVMEGKMPPKGEGFEDTAGWLHKLKFGNGSVKALAKAAGLSPNTMTQGLKATEKAFEEGKIPARKPRRPRRKKVQ